MRTDDRETIAYTTPRREAYAAVLHRCVILAFVLLLVSFGLYAGGWVAPHVPLESLPSQWGLPSARFMAMNQIQGGWSWLRWLPRGEFLCRIGLAFLALTTVFGYLRVLPFFLREKSYTLAAIAGLEILVLLAAASGVFSIAH